MSSIWSSEEVESWGLVAACRTQCLSGKDQQGGFYGQERASSFGVADAATDWHNFISLQELYPSEFLPMMEEGSPRQEMPVEGAIGKSSAGRGQKVQVSLRVAQSPEFFADVANQMRSFKKEVSPSDQVRECAESPGRNEGTTVEADKHSGVGAPWGKGNNQGGLGVPSQCQVLCGESLSERYRSQLSTLPEFETLEVLEQEIMCNDVDVAQRKEGATEISREGQRENSADANFGMGLIATLTDKDDRVEEQAQEEDVKGVGQFPPVAIMEEDDLMGSPRSQLSTPQSLTEQLRSAWHQLALNQQAPSCQMAAAHSLSPTMMGLDDPGATFGMGSLLGGFGPNEDELPIGERTGVADNSPLFSPVYVPGGGGHGLLFGHRGLFDVGRDELVPSFHSTLRGARGSPNHEGLADKFSGSPQEDDSWQTYQDDSGSLATAGELYDVDAAQQPMLPLPHARPPQQVVLQTALHPHLSSGIRGHASPEQHQPPHSQLVKRHLAQYHQQHLPSVVHHRLPNPAQLQQAKLSASQGHLQGSNAGAAIQQTFSDISDVPLGRVNSPRIGTPQPAAVAPAAAATAAQEEYGEQDELDRLKAEIVGHPLYEQLLEAHVACLKVATPLDQLPLLDLQLDRAELTIQRYQALQHQQCEQATHSNQRSDLDWFMAHYVVLLRSFKCQLEQHVRVHAREAVLACWDLEQSFISITGMELGPGSGLVMSDDEVDLEDSEGGSFEDGGGAGPYGPLVPTDGERSIMERMRQELKQELKQNYRSRIADVRDEIMRKRRAGKLPGDTTAVLKAWWNTHAKWPYPTEEEKQALVSQTGLELKQINNWFINQRKRNWHTNPSGTTSSQAKSAKRKQQQK